MAQRHRTTAQSASEIRKAGDQPFGHYAAAWLESMEVKVARGQLKSARLTTTGSCSIGMCSTGSAVRPSRPSRRDSANSFWQPWFGSNPGKAQTVC